MYIQYCCSIDTILPTPGLETPHVMRIVAVLKLTGSPRYGMSHIRGVEFRVLFEKKRTENTERDCRTEAGEF